MINLTGSSTSSQDHSQSEYNKAMDLAATLIDVSQAKKRKMERKPSYDFQSPLHGFQQIPYTQRGYWKGSPPNVRTLSFNVAGGRESSRETINKSNFKGIKGQDMHLTRSASSQSQDSILDEWRQAWHGRGDMPEMPESSRAGRLRSEKTVEEERNKKSEIDDYFNSQVKNMKHAIKSSPSRGSSQKTMENIDRQLSPSAKRSKSVDSEVKDWQGIFDMWRQS